MREHLSKRVKVVAALMAILLTIQLTAMLLSEATATPSPVEIVFFDPDIGPVGTIVTVIGEIDTLGGSYQIWWDYEILLKEGNCQSGSTEVYDTFTVPFSSEGVHNVFLLDITSVMESAPMQFFLVTITLSMDPARIQEGLNTTITVDLQGSAEIKNYTLTTNVTAPTTASYTADLNVTTDEVGFGTVSKIYWEEFLGSNTHFVGTYRVAVNESLATGKFTVGLTDKLVYETMETVYIRGSGYYPDENVTVNVKFGEASVTGYPKNVTADMEGVVIDSWDIPLDAVTGTYIVTLVSATTPGTIKEPADVQEFNVNLICQIQTRNLDDESVADVTVEVYNATTGDFLISEKTNKTGWAIFFLKTGNFTFNAFRLNVHVGSLPNQTLVESSTLILECQLARVRMIVKDENQVPLPFIGISLTCNYSTRGEENLTKEYSLETNFTGIAEALNLFTNINYTLEARRYGLLFNTTLIENLTTSIWIYITCPTYVLFIQVLDSKGIPLRNVGVAVYEWTSGVAEPVQSETTDDLGSAVFQDLTFGRFKIWVYNEDHTIILNKTIVDLTEDQLSFVIHCKIFKVDLSFIVKDYFGHPISNALVEIDIENVGTSSKKTGSDGIVSFHNVTGGNCLISVSVMGKLSEARALYLDDLKVTVFKLEKFVVLGAYLLKVNQLITCISLGIVIFLFILAFIHQRLRLRKTPERVKERKNL